MLLSVSVGLGLVSGCGSDGLTPGKEVDQSELYWALELNHHAVTLAPPDHPPYDTLPLVATPRTADGAPLSGLPAPTYVSSDQEKVAVTSDGVLRATGPMAPGEMVLVVATLTAGNLKHADTVLVTVSALDPRPVLDSFSIHPTPNNAGYADSAKVGGSPFGNSSSFDLSTTCFALPTWTQPPPDCRILLPVVVLDATGAPIPGVPVAFRSSDEETATVIPPLLPDGLHAPGQIIVHWRAPTSQVTFYASTTVFGITKADTLPFRIGWPTLVGIAVSQTGFSVPLVRLGVGGVVSWQSDESSDIDINFVDPTNVAEVGQPAPGFFRPNQAFFICNFAALCNDAGNIVMNHTSFGFRLALRRFPVPGTYDYSSTTLGGASGRIIVMDDQ